MVSQPEGYTSERFCYLPVKCKLGSIPEHISPNHMKSWRRKIIDGFLSIVSYYNKEFPLRTGEIT